MEACMLEWTCDPLVNVWLLFKLWNTLKSGMQINLGINEWPIDAQIGSEAFSEDKNVA